MGMKSNSIFRYSRTSTNPLLHWLLHGCIFLRAHEGSKAMQSTGLKVLHTNRWVVANCLQMCWVAGNPVRWQYLEGCGKKEEGLGVPVAISRTAGCRLAAAGVAGQAVRAARDASATCSGEEDTARGARGLARPRHWHPVAALPYNAVPSDASPEPWLRERDPPFTAAFRKTFGKTQWKARTFQNPQISQQHTSSTVPSPAAGRTLTNSRLKAPPPAPHRILRCHFSLRLTPKLSLSQPGQPQPWPWPRPRLPGSRHTGGALVLVVTLFSGTAELPSSLGLPWNGPSVSGRSFPTALLHLLREPSRLRPLRSDAAPAPLGPRQRSCWGTRACAKRGIWSGVWQGQRA